MISFLRFALRDAIAHSNREWSRQFVDAPFFSRFAPAIELDVDGTTASHVQGQPRDVLEDANIRAAQATLFRSRGKGTPVKEDKRNQAESNAAPRNLGPVTPSDRAAASPVVKGTPVAKANGKFDATPVKAATIGLAGTPNGALSSGGSKQRCEGVGIRVLWLLKLALYCRLKRRWSGSAFNIINSK